MHLSSMVRVRSPGRNEVKARQGIDTLDTIRTNDNSFIWVEMRLKPDRALTHSMLLIVSLFVFCRNEVKARQGIDTPAPIRNRLIGLTVEMRLKPDRALTQCLHR